MSEGIDQVRVVLQSGIALVNAEQKLVSLDWKVVLKQVLDLDESEANALATEFGILDLNDNQFEALVQTYVVVGARYAAIVLRVLRLFLPK